MQLTFLRADCPLTKLIHFDLNGNKDVQPYPFVKRFTSHTEELSSLSEFFDALVSHASIGNCLYKGLLDRPLINESRAGHTLTNLDTQWVCLDLDDFPAASISDAMRMLGINVQHIVHYSSSAGFTNALRAHVFFMLSKPQAPTLLKSWLEHLNLLHDLPTALTASQTALKWPLDISTCQNDKLLYIAPPVITGRSDPVPQRFELINHPSRPAAFELPAFPANTDQRKLDLINEIRSAQGFSKKRTLKLKYEGDNAILPNPDAAIVTGVKEARGYTYLNLNGGDSWGYYYPSSRPTLLYNFKGEPVYRLRDIVPDYFAQLQAAPPPPPPEVEPVRDTTGIERFVINDAYTSQYLKVEYDTVRHTIELLPAKDRKRLEDFCSEYNLPDPLVVPTWRVGFDPTNETIVDHENRFINQFQPTPYWVETHKADLEPDPQALDPIRRTLLHALGGCQESYGYFLNWLAYIWQTGRKPKTAWIFHGRTGTGKGLFFRVLEALFGPQTKHFTVDNLSDRFTGPLATAQLVLVDETDSDQFDAHKLAPRIRSWITEDTLPIRGMRKESKDMPSFFGMILAANLRNAASLTADDRRYNIPPRQEVSLADAIAPVTTGEWVEQVLDEQALLHFAAFLQSYEVNPQTVAIPMESDARKAMQDASISSPDQVVNALNDGNLLYFVQNIPPIDDTSDHTIDLVSYRQLMAEIMEEMYHHPLEAKVPVPLGRSELRTMFRYLVGWKSPPGKFEVSLKRYGIDLIPQAFPRGESKIMGTLFFFTMTERCQLYYETVTKPKKEHVKLYALAGGKA